MSSFRKKRSDMKILLFWNFSFCDTSQLFFLGPMSLPDSLSLFILKDIWNRLTHWSNWDLIDVSLSVDDAGSKLVQIVVVVVVVVVIDVEVSVEEALVTVTQFGDRLVLIIHIDYNRWLGNSPEEQKWGYKDGGTKSYKTIGRLFWQQNRPQSDHWPALPAFLLNTSLPPRTKPGHLEGRETTFCRFILCKRGVLPL